MSAPLDCPAVEGWQAVLDETVPPEQRERYERHLESCPACQARLDRAEGCDDTMRHFFRQAGSSGAEPADPTLEQLLERMADATYLGRTAAADPIDLDFLRPADPPGVLGTLGEYEVKEVIGRGGMGVVLKAFDPALHRVVAIKVLAPALADSPDARRRFTREAQAAAAVCHDHIVAVHAVREADGLPYLVMQYVPGESLQEKLDRAGPLEAVDVVRIGVQTAQALAAAHAQGLIHRDVKPANILLEDGLARVKVTDFGLARMADDAGLTGAGVVAGTPAYMAPEQARGEQVDHRADLFSLGSVLYALCTGGPPFRGATPLAVLRQVSDGTQTPVRALNPEVPAWLESLVGRLLAKDPAGRFQSAAEVAALLEGYLAHLRQPAAVPAPALPRPSAGSCSGPAGPRPRTTALEWVPLRLRRTGLVLLIALGLGLIGVGLRGAGGGTPGQKEYAQEYSQSFRGNGEDNRRFEFFGPDAGQCVRFGPDGLRIALPLGYPDVRPNTGLTAGITVQGDFEITVGFEVLQEPEPAAARERQTRFTLDVALDRPGLNAATLSRTVDGKGVQFVTWSALQREMSGPPQKEMHYFPGAGRSGRLRLVRVGSALSYYHSEGDDPDFTLLRQDPFDAADLKAVRLVGSTGAGNASLDVRVTDLHIKAQSLPDLPAGTGRRGGGRGWLGAALAVGLLTLLAGLWLFVRQARRAGLTASTAAGEGGAAPAAGAPPVSFPCPGCRQKLKVKAGLAGKKVKCPQCGRAVLVAAAAP
jgi:serine/threonine protein kinase